MKPSTNPGWNEARSHIAQRERECMAVHLKAARQHSDRLDRLSKELENQYIELLAVKKEAQSLLEWLNQIASNYGLEPVHIDSPKK